MELVRERRGDDAAASFHHAVSAAFFVDGADIADPNVIGAMAEAVGVSPGEVRAAWQTHAFRTAVDASMARSRAAGVRGVPAYGWPGQPAVSGMMEPERIVSALTAAD
jgi:predicted DsbA family dithiol-disulfide isomerase